MNLRQAIEFLLSISLIAVSMSSFAQKPIITSIDKTSGANGEIVTLRGNSFGTVPTDLRVMFGGTKGIVHSATDQLVEVKVPAGATYNKIALSHAPSGLTEYTKEDFLLSFGGDPGFDPALLEGQKDFSAKVGTPKTGLYDLCLCDFDGDGKTDVAAANRDITSITILQNTTSAPGTLANITFAEAPASQTLLNANSIHSTCGDLNGDGKPELIISEFSQTGIADRVFIYHNASTGTGSFVFNRQFIRLTGSIVKQIRISDLDQDGRPELIITNTRGVDIGGKQVANVMVLVNQSNSTSVSFNSTPITINLPDNPATTVADGAANTDGISVSDLNGDGKPDIVTGQFLENNIFILRNTSTVGHVSFADHIMLSLGGTIANLKVGDLDQDGKPDIAATQLFGQSISIFLNTTADNSTNITFRTPSTISIDALYGLEFGDLDGDHKTDIVSTVVSISSIPTLVILNNQSTPGNLSFQRYTRPITYVTRYLLIGDIDGDAKPDIALASQDNDNTSIIGSKISILRNKSCQRPVVDPAGPHTICAGFPLTLTTGSNPGTIYKWKNNAGTTVASGLDPFYSVTASESYTVTAESEGGSCALTSTPAVQVTVEAGGSLTGTAVPTYDGIGALCINSELQLRVATDVGATKYKWHGPDGYEKEGPVPDKITSFQQVNAGRYSLDVYSGTCIAQKADIVIEIITLPDFKVIVNGSTVVCPPDNKPLSVSPSPTSFSYEWLKRSGSSVGTGPAYNATASGEYYVRAQYTLNPACATVETQGVVITFADPITADFTPPATACRGQDLTFTNTSTTGSSLPITYLWDYGDNTATSSDRDGAHKYLTASNNFPVKLTVSYENGACASSRTRSLIVKAATLATITTPGGQFAFCPGESLVLQVNGSFTNHNWSTNEATPSITVTQAGLYSVTVNTPEGCTVNASQDVLAFNAPVVAITSNPPGIAEGHTAELTATGLQDYTWEPGETLSDPTIPNPAASPLVTTVYTVTGSDANGCPGEATYELEVQAGSVYVKLKPSPFFSPGNGDEFGQFWNVDRIEEFPQCQVAVYDDKGIKVFEAKPYTNTWEGTFNGKKLPDGVYYFIIKCAGEQNSPKTGSITLLR